ncbi:MAG: hypothetical protein FWF10_03470 [Clostridiales bacterium]|nr:hypothetical protein [Clostridiales bacterium]
MEAEEEDGTGVRRGLFVIAILFLLAACAPPAPARRVYDPENAFYLRNREDCAREGRDFLINGEDGYVPVLREPGAGPELDRIPNNAVCYAFCTYQGRWALVLHMAPDDGRRTEGWVALDGMLAIYNRHDFYADHADAFYTCDGDYSALQSAETIVLWAWPGSGIKTGSLTHDKGFRVTEAWRDETGRVWGWFWLPAESEPHWVCLSDPSNENIPGTVPPPFPWTAPVPIGYGRE